MTRKTLITWIIGTVLVIVGIIIDLKFSTHVFLSGYLTGAITGIFYFIYKYIELEYLYSKELVDESVYIWMGLFQTVIRMFLILVVGSWYGVAYIYFLNEEN